MTDNGSYAISILALILYLLGGVSVFGGLALILLGRGHDLWGWGEGRSLGYLFLCIGLCLTVAGVLLMRFVRNRQTG
jgi:hypothetical protein